MEHDFVERSRDWFRQAERDLQHARESNQPEWACFAAQQSSEKAVKALYQAYRGEGRGHSIVLLLRGIAQKLPIPEPLMVGAALLDRMDFTSQPPNVYDLGIPADYLFLDDADRAIREADGILEFIRPHIP